MSYCRSGDDSDVYVIGTKDYLECFGAGWQKEATVPVHDKGMVPSYENKDGKIVPTGEEHETHVSFTTNTRSNMIAHLLEHRRHGHRVPQYAIDRLSDEIVEYGDDYTI